MTALRELAAKATPGPWHDFHDEDDTWGVVGDDPGNTNLAQDTTEADAAYIAALVNAAPALLDERDRLERERDEAQMKLSDSWHDADQLRAQAALKWWLLADVYHAENESIADMAGHCNHDESPPECIAAARRIAAAYNALRAALAPVSTSEEATDV